MDKFVDKVTDKTKEVVDKVTEKVTKIVEDVTEFVEDVKEVAEDVKEATVKLAQDFFEAIKRAANFDFGADYANMAFQAFTRGNILSGIVFAIDALCEAAYDTIVVEAVTAWAFGVKAATSTAQGGARV